MNFQELLNSNQQSVNSTHRKLILNQDLQSNKVVISETLKEVLWKLAHRQLGPEQWKELAKHWAFTSEQIKAIEHQYTGK